MRYPAPKPACELASFLNDVNHHQITVLRDDGINRHLRFEQPGNSNRWYEIVTWHSRLVITGDSGTFVFSRLTDMFEFFRSDSMKINPQYWEEKCLAQDRHDAVRKWSPEYFEHRVWEWMKETSATKKDRREVVEEVISVAHDGEARAMCAAMDFQAESGFRLQDFWEADCTIFSHYYLWCCYGIAWGIERYDELKAGRTPVGWTPSEAGLNLQATSLSAGHYMTNVPDSGWVLYSRRGDGVWEQRTDRRFAPSPYYEPALVNGVWVWKPIL